MVAEDTKAFGYAIEAVFLAFVAVVAVALERAYRGPRLVEKQNFADKQWGLLRWESAEVSYWAVLTVLVSLGIRFLIGSAVHLHASFVDNPGLVRDFMWHVLWLFIFGSFIVRSAFAESVREFSKWLTWFAVAGISWSLVAIATHSLPKDGSAQVSPSDAMTRKLAMGWLIINGLQFVATFSLWKLSKNEPTGTNQQVNRLVVLAVAFGLLFIADACHILDGSFWRCISSVFHCD